VTGATVKGVFLAVRFVLELCMLAALAYWGFTLDAALIVRILAGLGAPLAAMLVWGALVAPRRTIDAPAWLRLAVELAILALAVIALAAAGQPGLAAALAVAWLVDLAGLRLLGA
jgi:hypothetical protein